MDRDPGGELGMRSSHILSLISLTWHS